MKLSLQDMILKEKLSKPYLTAYEFPPFDPKATRENMQRLIASVYQLK